MSQRACSEYALALLRDAPSDAGPAAGPTPNEGMRLATAIYLNANQVRERYGNITYMTLFPWIRDEKLGFPAPISNYRRRLWKESDLDQFGEQQQARNGGPLKLRMRAEDVAIALFGKPTTPSRHEYRWRRRGSCPCAAPAQREGSIATTKAAKGATF